MKKNFLPVILMLSIAACTQQKVDTKAEGEKVMQTSREWAKVTETKNLDKIVSYWADDAILLMPGQPLLNGKKQIRQMVESSFKTPGFKITWDPQRVEISESGDLAYLVEKTHVSMNDSTGKTITQNLNAVTIWKKQPDGSWKNVVDMSTNE